MNTYDMDLFCPPPNSGNSSTNYQRHDNFNQSLINWDYGDFTRQITVPFLCAFGIIGNILNILILSKRIREGKRK